MVGTLVGRQSKCRFSRHRRKTSRRQTDPHDTCTECTRVAVQRSNSVSTLSESLFVDNGPSSVVPWRRPRRSCVVADEGRMTRALVGNRIAFEMLPAPVSKLISINPASRTGTPKKVSRVGVLGRRFEATSTPSVRAPAAAAAAVVVVVVRASAPFGVLCVFWPCVYSVCTVCVCVCVCVCEPGVGERHHRQRPGGAQGAQLLLGSCRWLKMTSLSADSQSTKKKRVPTRVLPPTWTRTAETPKNRFERSVCECVSVCASGLRGARMNPNWRRCGHRTRFPSDD